MLLAGAAAADASSLRYDHGNPLVLNEFAVRMAKQGDIGSAIILLERAVLLAPHDARLRRNLDALRLPQVPGGGDQAAPHSAATTAATPLDSSPPGLPPVPLWPLK